MWLVCDMLQGRRPVRRSTSFMDSLQQWTNKCVDVLVHEMEYMLRDYLSHQWHRWVGVGGGSSSSISRSMEFSLSHFHEIFLYLHAFVCTIHVQCTQWRQVEATCHLLFDGCCNEIVTL